MLFIGKKCFRNFSFWLATVVAIVVTLTSIFYTLHVLNNVGGYIFAILMALANLYMTLLITFNTTVSKRHHSALLTTNELEQKRSRAKKILAVAIPCLLLNVTSIFISSWQSLELLGGTISFISSDAISGIALTVATFTTLSALLYGLIQSYEIWQRMVPTPNNSLLFTQDQGNTSLLDTHKSMLITSIDSKNHQPQTISTVTENSTIHRPTRSKSS